MLILVIYKELDLKEITAKNVSRSAYLQGTKITITSCDMAGVE